MISLFGVIFVKFFPCKFSDEEHLLAPGLIAAITIGSMFIFYFTIMMIVCLGEYYQYIHGKKEKVSTACIDERGTLQSLYHTSS